MFWLSINERILQVIVRQKEETFKRQIELPDGKTSDVMFLFADYVAHLESYINQIKK